MGTQAGGNIGKNWRDLSDINALYGNFSSLGKALQMEVAERGIDTKDQPQWIAKHHAQALGGEQGYFTQVFAKDSVSSSFAWDVTEEMAKKASKMYSPTRAC